MAKRKHRNIENYVLKNHLVKTRQEIGWDLSWKKMGKGKNGGNHARTYTLPPLNWGEVFGV